MLDRERAECYVILFNRYGDHWAYNAPVDADVNAEKEYAYISGYRLERDPDGLWSIVVPPEG